MAKILIGNIKGKKGDKGDKGDTGASFKILDFFNTEEELNAVENPSTGDAYGVLNANELYDIYVYSPTKGWVNNGELAPDINNQTPNFEESKTLEELKSSEKISLAFGKIARAISELISHLKNKNNPHEVTASDVGAFPSTGGILNGYLGISAESYPGVEFHSPNNLSRIMRNVGKDVNGNEFDYGLILSDFDSKDQAESVSLMLSCKEVLMNASAMTYALRLSSIINGQIKYYNIFGEHNASAYGLVKMQCNSYIGTGNYGENSKNSITFEKIPEMVTISLENDNVNGASGAIATFTKGARFGLVHYTSGNAYSSYGRVALTWSDNTLSWYSVAISGNEIASADAQLNVSGAKYSWKALYI